MQNQSRIQDKSIIKEESLIWKVPSGCNLTVRTETCHCSVHCCPLAIGPARSFAAALWPFCTHYASAAISALYAAFSYLWELCNTFPFLSVTGPSVQCLSSASVQCWETGEYIKQGGAGKQYGCPPPGWSTGGAKGPLPPLCSLCKHYRCRELRACGKK